MTTLNYIITGLAVCAGSIATYVSTRSEVRTYRQWYLLCREAMERDGGPECQRVLEHIGQRTSKRDDFEREFWGDLPPEPPSS